MYQSLTAEQQTAIDEAAAEAMDYFYDLYEDIEADAKQAMVDAGVSFVEIDKGSSDRGLRSRSGGVRGGEWPGGYVLCDSGPGLIPDTGHLWE